MSIFIVVFTRIVLGLVASVIILHFKGLFERLYAPNYIISVFFFALIAPLLFLYVSALSQSDGLWLILAYVAPALLLLGLVVKNPVAIPLTMFGCIFCVMLLPALLT
ncbi:hypothetical protein [Deinococcus aquatilis]|uniref:hypothetical protein n=1 Tax=Deinococcus aquatilis TaxID=519440 RepID=UPI00037FF17E|nr:hypothetical protein [Deinococcus aquatilis]